MGLATVLKGITSHPFNRTTKCQAIAGFVKWQLGSRLVPGPVLVDFVNCSKLLVGRGMTGATGNLYSGLHEFEDMGFLLHFLRVDDLFVDIGANIGSYTILASSAVEARTVSFEPIPSTFAWLQKNVAVNGASDRVKLCNKGVGSKSDILVFSANQDTTNHVIVNSSAQESTEHVSVEVVALDEFLDNEKPTLLKIDVEGFESEVLEGAHRTLSSADPQAVIMEINGSGEQYGASDEDLLLRMKGFGFDTFSYDPFTRKLISLKGRGSQAGNTLFIKSADFVKSRLSSAAPFTVKGRQI